MPGAPDWVAVGRVLKPRGVSGEAFLAPLTDFPERFEALDSVVLEGPNGARQPVRVAYVEVYGKRLAIKFRGVDTSEGVARFRGRLVLIPREAVYPLPEDTYYVFEIVGLRVETETGEVVGTVVDVLSMPAQDVYVVDRDGRETLVPAARDLVTVDVDRGRIVVRHLEGLF